LAEAAAIYDNKNAAESCSYGPEARGAASRAEIVISDKAIDYPKPESIDFFMALTQKAFDKHMKDMGPDAILVAESQVATGDEAKKRTVYTVPFAEIAERECGRASLVNIVALGFFARVNDVINRKSIRQAILARIPKMSEELYLKAYEAGLQAAEERLKR